MTCLVFDNPQTAFNTSESSIMPESWGSLSSIAEKSERNRDITVGGVRRLKTDQEKNDRQLAMRLVKEQEGEEKKRSQRIEQRIRRVETEKAE